MLSGLDHAAGQVLAQFPSALYSGGWSALKDHRGFSGAMLWRVAGERGSLLLRAWPVNGPSPKRLVFIHQHMRQARQAGLTCVPLLHATPHGRTTIEHGGRSWEMMQWMPGRADYRTQPTKARLEAACVELARLHQSWHPAVPINEPCPAVTRRIERAGEWRQRLASGWQMQCADDLLRPWLERADQLVRQWVDRVTPMLAFWSARPTPLQPCLCDVWHDHVLFEGDQVSGLIDYGEVKIDHVSVDIARLLGSMVEDDPSEWNAGLHAYRGVRALSAEEEALARVLDRTGVIVGATTWLRWAAVEGRVMEDRRIAAVRLAELVARMTKW